MFASRKGTHNLKREQPNWYRNPLFSLLWMVLCWLLTSSAQSAHSINTSPVIAHMIFFIMCFNVFMGEALIPFIYLNLNFLKRTIIPSISFHIHWYPLVALVKMKGQITTFSRMKSKCKMKFLSLDLSVALQLYANKVRCMNSTRAQDNPSLSHRGLQS